MSVLQVRNFEKSFGAFKAVHGISFSLAEGEILAIIGPSGCGKTTTLRCIAGLERPTGGEIIVGGRTVASSTVFVPPEKRDIGMVFQSYALWPHKTVFQNIAYGLNIKNMPKDQIAEAVARTLDLVGLRGLEQRYPAELSGGQQQRVALARSVIGEPRIILLDEPLSNLDAKLRERMRDDIRSLIRSLNISAVHITHDQSEAMGIADRIICMHAGYIEQEGSARDIYRKPLTMFAADFFGTVSFLDGEVIAVAPGQASIRVAPQVELTVAVRDPVQPGDKVTVALRPESVTMSTTPTAGANALTGTIASETFLGSYSDYIVATGGLSLRARTNIDLPVGTTVYCTIDPAQLNVFPAGSK